MTNFWVWAMELGRSVLLNVLNACINLDVSFGDYVQLRSKNDVLQVSQEKMTENDSFSRSILFLVGVRIWDLANRHHICSRARKQQQFGLGTSRWYRTRSHENDFFRNSRKVSIWNSRFWPFLGSEWSKLVAVFAKMFTSVCYNFLQAQE